MSDSKFGDYHAPRGQAFEVVMIKDGVGQHAAKPEDFKRVPVVAESPFAARSAEEVAAAEKAGWTTVQVAAPGQPTHPEHMARLRAHEAASGGPLDRTKI